MPWFTCHRCGKRARTESKKTNLIVPFAMDGDPEGNKVYLTLCDGCIEHLINESYVVSEPVCC